MIVKANKWHGIAVKLEIFRKYGEKIMQDFLMFFNKKSKVHPMHLEICYDKNIGWSVYVYKKDLKDGGKDLDIMYARSFDMELCFADAQVKLKNWFLNNVGGY